MKKIVTISDWTVKEPLEMIGEMAGICYGADTSDKHKNIKRAWDCIDNMHNRTEEFPDIYLVMDNFSAKVMREFYTHIGGMPTRLQESTRYVDYTKEENFMIVTPPAIDNNEKAKAVFDDATNYIHQSMNALKDLGIAKEDFTFLIPMGMRTKVVCKINLRALIEMSRTRLCNRAMWEYRDLMKAIIKALSEYSPQWNLLVKHDGLFVPKCEVYGFCPEKKSCGRKNKKEDKS